MLIYTYVYELGLYRSRVNTLVVEEFFDLFGDLHVLGQVTAANVCGCDYSITSELPHVEFVHGQHAVHVFE